MFVENKLTMMTMMMILVPWVEKDEFEVEAGAKHKHVAVKFDLGDGAARQRVTDRHKAGVLIAAVKARRSRVMHGTLTYLQVPAAVDHLPTTQRTPTSAQHSLASRYRLLLATWFGNNVLGYTKKKKKRTTVAYLLHPPKKDTVHLFVDSPSAG